MNEIAQTIVSLVILGIMGIVILILDQFWPPNKRGFFADDQSLAYPYHGDTIPFIYLLGVGIIIHGKATVLEGKVTRVVILSAHNGVF